MASDFQVTGGQEIAKLAKALKEAGRTDLRKGLVKGLQEGAKPLIPLTREAARRELPKRGGLNELVAKAPQRVSVLTGKTPGVRLVAGRKGSGAPGADRGKVRHPVFGHQDRYVEQTVPDGWFTETIPQHINVVVPALEKAIEDVLEEVVRRG